MKKDFVLEAEMMFRKKANTVYQTARTDDTAALIKANHYVDVADELETLRPFLSLQDFQQCWNALVNECSEQNLERLYNETIVVTFHGLTTEIPFDAVAVNAITKMLDEIHKEAE